MTLPLTARRHPRRLALLAIALVICVVASLAISHSIGHATTGASAYDVPDVVDTNPDPNVVETTLVSANASVDVGGGKIAHAQTYNGTIPGPTFRLKVGDTVIVHYQNKLDRPSGVHWHGIELANAIDGTPFTQNMVNPGGTFLYKFKVTRPGIFWYHPHHHSSTDQVFRGLYGMIVVTDPNEAALQASGTLPPASQTKQIVLSDTTICHTPPNDAATYNPASPWVGGGALPAQAKPTPKELCDGGTAGAPGPLTTYPVDEDGNTRGPYAAGDIPAIQTELSGGRENEGQTVLTNGKNVGGRAGTPGAPGALAAGAETLDVKAGQGLRLQILNASTIRYMRLRLMDNSAGIIPLVRVGGEGGLLNKAVVEGDVLPVPPLVFATGFDRGETLVPPGSRVDVVAAIPPGTTGVLTMWTEDYSRTGMGFTNTPTVPVMHLNVNGTATPTYTIGDGTPLRNATGNPVVPLGTATGSTLNPATFSPAKLGDATTAITLSAVAGSKLGVNGTFGTHDVTGDYSAALHLASTRYAEVGDILELTTENTTGAHHPFHLHGFSIQPLDLTKAASPTFTFDATNPEFRDNVDIPAGYKLRFRVRIDPRPLADGVTPGGELGRWVFHCHIFFHATNGMLSELVVVPSSAGNERPDVNVDNAQVTVNQGQTAAVTGSFADRDGNPVTLSSSVGTVAPTGGGAWSWSFPTGTTDSRIVYVTATDSNGAKSEIPFQLTINNTPPTVNAPATATVPRGLAVSFGVSATDPDAVDPLTLAPGALPAGLAFAGGPAGATVSGVVTAPVGVYPLAFSASDGKHAPTVGNTALTVTNPLGFAITKASLLRTKFAVSSKATAVSAKAKPKKKKPPQGSSVRFTLSVPALATLKVSQVKSGRKVGKTCHTPTRANRKRKPCTRLVARGSLKRNLKTGAASIPFSGRIGTKALAIGRYQLAISALDSIQRSAKGKTLSFSVVHR